MSEGARRRLVAVARANDLLITGRCNMAGNDQRRVEAAIYIGEAVRLLQTAQSKHLDHTDLTTVQAALEGLGIVRRSVVGAAVPDDARVAARLRQVAQ